jgi:hypothetical protein
VGPPPVPGPVPAPAARACPFGYGIPPRQTFSYFSAPCAPAFSGKNGGATYKGVSGDEVRVAVGDPNGDHGTEGPVPDEPYPNEGNADRTLRVWQKYFNTHYQFWGRRLQLINVLGDDNSDETKMRATAVKADSYHVFAADIGRFPTMDEFARRGIISFAEQGDQFSAAWLASHKPFAWGMRTDSTKLTKLTAEFYCKSLVGKAARYGGDPTITSAQRVVGFLYQDNDAYRDNAAEFRKALADDCGAKVGASIGFPGSGSSSLDANSTSTAVSQLRAAGVTTVVTAFDVADAAAVTATATAQGYFPEWLVSGIGLLDCNLDASLQDPRQWSHAFGIAESFMGDTQGLPGADMRYDIGYRAYKEIEPNTEPDSTMTIRLFLQLEQIANGIQMAGPNLTPQTFEQGLFRMGPRTGDLPPWEWVGGFGPSDYTFSDKVSVIWWDKTAASDNTSDSGSYRWLNGARRYGLGQLPTGDYPDLFVTGISRRQQATG